MPRYFDDFTVGQKFTSPRRTVTETDIVNYAALTGDWNPVHTDEVYARGTPFGERVAHGPMTIGVAFGLLSRLDLFDGTVLALRSIEWSFDNPVRIGDTVHVVATVAETSPHPRQTDRGRLIMDAAFVNQRLEQVSQGRFTVVILRRKSAGPSSKR